MIGGVPRFGHISLSRPYMRTLLYSWLQVQLSSDTASSEMHLHNLLELFIMTSACSNHQSLRSASRGNFAVPHALTVTKVTKFLHCRSSVSYSLPSDLRSLPRDLFIVFLDKLLKTFRLDEPGL